MKKIIETVTKTDKHWVGDGFPVRSIFGYNHLGQKISPFLLMDYAEPTVFEPSEHIRGVGEHPHRGFETVTIVYDGEVEHRDSFGGGGKIGPGDVQWMTAASGLVHEEMHGKEFAKKGGSFEMIQLWVNLSKKDKSARPKYQGITDNQIPSVNLQDGAGRVRVIAGQFDQIQGPATTFSPINVWDVRIHKDKKVKFKSPEGHTTVVFILDGSVTIDGKIFVNTNLVVLESEGTDFEIEANTNSKILILTGEPIDEPVIGYGPFVMNSVEEIQQAFVDFQNGKMGTLPEVQS